MISALFNYVSIKVGEKLEKALSPRQVTITNMTGEKFLFWWVKFPRLSSLRDRYSSSMSSMYLFTFSNSLLSSSMLQYPS